MKSKHLDEYCNIAVVSSVRQIEWTDDDVALIGVKSQDTDGILADLDDATGPRTPVVCLQNGLTNEDSAARRFIDVYGAAVFLRASYLTPGEIVNYSTPCPGVFVLGRYPYGSDDFTIELAHAFTLAGFEAIVVDNILAWKRRKLLTNLSSAVDIVSGHEDGFVEAVGILAMEGEAVFAAAGLEVVDTHSFAAQMARIEEIAIIPQHPWTGGSTAQSIQRGCSTTELDSLNGEVMRLGRANLIPTPANDLVTSLAAEVVAKTRAPSSIPMVDLLGRLHALH